MNAWGEFLERPPVRRAVLAGWVVLCLVLAAGIGWQLRARVRHKESIQAFAQINDFERWMRMVPAFIRDHADYRNDSFPTPPVTLLVFQPLTMLAPADAQFAWAACKGLFILAIGVAGYGMCRQVGVTPRVDAMVLVGLVWVWPLMGDLQQGQTNLLMLLPLVVGLWAAQRSEVGTRRVGWQLLGGALIGLAACIKVTPIIFLAYFLWRRRWLVATGMMAGMVLALLVIPAAAFGWDQNLKWLGQWTQIMIVPYAIHAQVDYGWGQSIPAMLVRFLCRIPAFVIERTTADSVPVPYFANVASLPVGVVAWVGRVILGGLACVGLWWMRRPLRSLASMDHLREVGVVGVFMLWASQRTWVPHLVSLALVNTALVAALSAPIAPRLRTGGCAAVLAAAGLMAMTSDVARIFGSHGPLWMETLGLPFAASVIMLIVLVRVSGAKTAIPPGIAGGTSAKP